MINGIGPSTAGAIGTQRGEAQKRVDGVQARADRAGSGAVATAAGRLVAEGAPVDTDRVSALRAAIRAGTYRADPDAIAARMIAEDLG